MQKWSAEKVISEITALHEGGEQINSGYVQVNHRPLYYAACRYLGGWSQAVEAAGFDVAVGRVNKEWSKEKVIQQISDLHEKGESLVSHYVFAHHGPLYCAASRYFGEWYKAVEAAGLDDPVRQNYETWSKEKVIQQISDLHEKGELLNSNRVQTSDYSLYSAACRYLGGWSQSVAAAGIDYNEVRKVYHHPVGWWTKLRIIKSIKDLEEEGISLTPKSMIEESQGALLHAAKDKFGSWVQALQAAGISYKDHYTVWSTKAWLRLMDDDRYSELVENAQQHAKKRRRS